MHARTLYNITRTRVFAGVQVTLAALAVLLFISCSNGATIEKIEEIDINGKDPLAFTCLTDNSEQEHNTTRAAQLLTTDFVVSTYKAYNTPNQYPVMTDYHVEYKTSGTAWDGNVRPYWDYTKVTGQYEKYWDYSAFPYRFHAVAPYPTNPAHVTFNDKALTINAPYSMQTSLNGMVTPTDRVAEPYLAAQLQRNPDGRDYDLLSTNHPLEINTGSQARNRYVALPFHHLNSKVRFGIYSTTPWTTANPLYIEGLTIRAYSPNFVTAATGYTATGTTAPGAATVLGSSASEYSWYLATGNSGFTNLVFSSSAAETPLLRFDGGKEVTDNDLSLHQGRSSAYWLQCKDGLMQIPQENVTLCVSFNLNRMDGTLYKSYNDIPIQLADGTRHYNWLSGYLHTYYLIIGGIEDNLEITFTATLTPWEDITGSLTTDLEQ